jgi:hypothetical protein
VSGSGIQRALSDFQVVPPRSPFAWRVLELFLIDEETRVTYKPFQFVHDVHGRWPGWLYYAKEAR